MNINDNSNNQQLSKQAWVIFIKSTMFMLILTFQVSTANTSKPSLAEQQFYDINGEASSKTQNDGIIFKSGFEYIRTKVNDTGITHYYFDDGSGSSIIRATCTSVTTPVQDCHQGRDAVLNDDSDGHAGFVFTKLDATGTPLIDQTADFATSPWACVKDNVTDLVWEVKSKEDGLHYIEDKYNWYNTDSSTNGGDEGIANDDGDICFGYDELNSSTFCNTQAFTARVNAQGLCGYNDWRLPNVNELLSIVDYGQAHGNVDASDRIVGIDINYFQAMIEAVTIGFWSSTTYVREFSNTKAMRVNFSLHSFMIDGKSHFFNYGARLVRDDQ